MWFKGTIAVVAFIAGVAVQGWRKDAAIEEERSLYLQDKNKALTLALVERDEALTRAKDAQTEFEVARVQIVSRDVANRRLLDELRHLREYASGGSDDTLTACRERAGKLGELLEEGSGLVAEGARLVDLRDAELKRDRAHVR